ncbi:MAG: cadmium-translocating P-type ATPase [Acidimicrobiia bacterium]|nr:cadmium-translocating P-type ATPase [Acidimicrobiia bacterium]
MSENSGPHRDHGHDEHGHDDHGHGDGHQGSWWQDRKLQIPLLSGLLLGAGLTASWLDAPTVGSVLFWAALVAGGSQFAPEAIERLFKGRLGIGLLMTISAVGAVILGHVQEAAALAFLYSIAEGLEHRAMDRARAGLRALLDLVPETATILHGGVQQEVESRDLQVGQVLLVRPGERVATDGIVLTGLSSVDTSAVTGESIPVDVSPGETIVAGSINVGGALKVEATAPGTDNSLTTIVSLVEQAQKEKGARARLADRIARPLIPGIIIVATLVAVIGSILGDPGVWIERALVVLVAASPCALAIAVPVTVVSGIGAASKFGVIVKSGAAFERLGEIRHVAVDKTGTLTRNQPQVVKVVPAPGFDETTLLNHAAGLEANSTHPLARAVTDAAPTTLPATGVTEHPGQGLTGVIEGQTIRVGSPRWIEPGRLDTQVRQLEDDGITVLAVANDDGIMGLIGVRDEIRSEAPETLADLAGVGIDVTMLTGDNHRTAKAIAGAAGISRVHAELRPEDKARIVTQLSQQRPTAMIGDGINDAPALAAADIGIAMGATGSDAAIESADVAFTGHDLRLIPQALHHARRAKKIINQNVVLSLAIITALVPLSAIGTLGLATVVLIHELAEVIVIGNGLRASRTAS